jgi:single-stranded-DNA-specific exonuclease
MAAGGEVLAGFTLLPVAGRPSCNKGCMAYAEEIGAQFLAFLSREVTLETRIHILTDSDADGLPAGAILCLALREAGYPNTTAEVRRRFESAWSPEVVERLRQKNPQALLVTDLGSRPDPILPGVATLLLDHHRPSGTPPGATLLSAYRTLSEGQSALEIPSTGLLAYWCARALLGDRADRLLWMAAISLLSDLGDRAPFPELAQAKKQYGAGALREVTSLLNAPRRSSAGDASAALELLLTCGSPKEILSSTHAVHTGLRDQLLAAKEEVGHALASARKLPPRFSTAVRNELGANLVAIKMQTPCQVHPLIAQQWRGRFPRSVVLGVNTGFRPGWVHFSGRAPHGVDLIGFLRSHRPEEADDQYGNGHDQAAGGALRTPVWNRFATDLGFGPDLLVDEAALKEEGSG